VLRPEVANPEQTDWVSGHLPSSGDRFPDAVFWACPYQLASRGEYIKLKANEFQDYEAMRFMLQSLKL
jgi:hypothetical protein